MTTEAQPNVLLVDDRADNLLAMQSVLADLDHNLVSASSAREALKYLLEEDFALILLDVQMPGLNGFELAELIRERERTQHTPIIFVSATSVDEQYVFKGYSLGAVDYLTKPIQAEILKSKVRFFTRLFQQNQEIKHQAELLEEANKRLDDVNADLEIRVRDRTAELEEANRKLERELISRAESEARLALEHAITRTLAGAENLQTAAPLILRAFSANLDAAVSAFWIPNRARTELHCVEVQTADNAAELNRFVSETRRLRLASGAGLPGSVWENNAPVWLSNTYRDDRFPRARFAAAAELQSAVGFPIRVGTDFLGVIEFYTRRTLVEEESFSNMLEAIGSEIGQFVHRKRVEAEREELLAREKALRHEAEKASRLKDEFLATVSHELRTPLNSILGWGQILHTAKLSEEDTRNALEAIYRNAKSQSQLIDDLLDTSRLITGNLHLDLSPAEVMPIIHSAIEVVRPAAESKKITIDTEFRSDISMLTCDAQRLQQMVWNLLTNAVKFTPAGGQVKIVYEHVDDAVCIIVRDTGNGISEDFLPHVFDRFRQADSSSTRSHDGLGLGLAIVRHLAELHGGTIKVESDGPGKGSAFTITLPLTLVVKPGTDTPPAEITNGKKSDARGAELKGVRVLIVDDDKDACSMMEFALGLSGADVSTYESVADAIRAINNSPPDILLTDINMPGEDGYSLIKKLRDLAPARVAGIPAIALTAMARPEDTERVLSAGFQMHIPKPVEIEELSAAISQLIRS